jgi:hypothetical protein
MKCTRSVQKHGETLVYGQVRANEISISVPRLLNHDIMHTCSLHKAAWDPDSQHAPTPPIVSRQWTGPANST